MKTWIKYLIALLIIALGGFVFYSKVYIPKTSFDIVKPTVGTLKVTVFGIGNVSAKDTYKIGAQTGGKILSLLSDEGEWVKKGDLLITIDPVDMPLLLQEAKIAQKKARLESRASQKEIESLQAQRRLALMTFERYKKLQKQGYASQAEYDKAQADLQSIDAQIASTKAHIASSKAEISRAQKQHEALAVKLSRLKVYSPVDGYVIARKAEVAQTVLPSQSVFEIVDPKTVWVKSYIDERISGDVRVGQSAQIVLRSQNNKRLNGVVKRIAAVSDAVTQEREINVAFETLPVPFYINEQAEVTIATKSYEDVLKVPLPLLARYDDKQGLWLLQDTKAHFQAVEVIAKSDQEAAIEGITKEVQIIRPESSKKPLKEGMRIH